MSTLRDYEIYGHRPKCSCCKKVFDPEEAVHDGYRGSPHAHGGAGSYGIGSHHFIFPKVCADCQQSCPLCELQREWSALDILERMLFLSNEKGGLLCDCGDYWLLGDGNEFLHKVKYFYAWEDSSSEEEYADLCKSLREEHGDDFNLPVYVPVSEQPDTTRAQSLYKLLQEAGLEVSLKTGAVEGEHVCKL